MSEKHLKYQEDCHVPAIGQMSGCITTDSGCLVTRNSWAVTLKDEKELENMKMRDDGRAKQQPHKVDSFTFKTR